MDLNQLTLAEVESLAERLGNAAKTIRDAQSMLMGKSVEADQTAKKPNPPSRLSPDEIAQREAILAQVRGPAEVSPAIAAAMNGAGR